MYKKILLLVDGSHRSEGLVASAAELALHENAAIVLLRVLERPLPMMGPAGSMLHTPPGWESRMEQEASMYLRTLQVRLEGMGVSTAARIAWGPAPEVVLTLAEKEEVDLVAMTTQPPSCLSRLLGRNLVQRIIAHRAVLVIPPADDDPSLSGIR